MWKKIKNVKCRLTKLLLMPLCAKAVENFSKTHKKSRKLSFPCGKAVWITDFCVKVCQTFKTGAKKPMFSTVAKPKSTVCHTHFPTGYEKIDKQKSQVAKGDFDFSTVSAGSTTITTIIYMSIGLSGYRARARIYSEKTVTRSFDRQPPTQLQKRTFVSAFISAISALGTFLIRGRGKSCFAIVKLTLVSGWRWWDPAACGSYFTVCALKLER